MHLQPHRHTLWVRQVVMHNRSVEQSISGALYLHCSIIKRQYRKVSNIRRAKSQNLSVSHLGLQLSLSNRLKPVFSGEWRCSWSSADRRCSNYNVHLSDQQVNCLLKCAEEHNLSPFDLNIACRCKSIEINNNKYVETCKLIETCWWITCADIEVISQAHAWLINVALWFYLTKYILSITIVWQVLCWN